MTSLLISKYFCTFLPLGRTKIYGRAENEQTRQCARLYIYILCHVGYKNRDIPWVIWALTSWEFCPIYIVVVFVLSSHSKEQIYCHAKNTTRRSAMCATIARHVGYKNRGICRAKTNGTKLSMGHLSAGQLGFSPTYTFVLSSHSINRTNVVPSASSPNEPRHVGYKNRHLPRKNHWDQT